MKIKYLIFTAILIFTTYLLLYLLNIINSQFFSASLIALILNMLNFGAAVALFYFSIEKSNKLFLFFNFGGLAVRMFALLIVIFIVLNSLKIDKYGFILQFFIFYFLLISIEIAIFHKTMLDRRRNNDTDAE